MLAKAPAGKRGSLLGVTFFGLLTPVFYIVIRGFAADTIKEDVRQQPSMSLDCAVRVTQRQRLGVAELAPAVGI